MIRRENEIRKREVPGPQGGTGIVTFYDWIETETDAPGHGRVISKVVLPKGASIGYHKHQGEFEAYTVISGQALVNDMGEEIILNPGDMHICKDGDSHGVACYGDEPLVFQAVILNTL